VHAPPTKANGLGASPAATRSPVQIRTEGNRLAHCSSLYLQQHGHNPVEWYPWGDEALARAREHDLPVFLSIGYASCHWCHVMEREVFESDEVAAYLNEHFVCIKVDREERPDLDAVYMAAVQAMTGTGGWPLSVFLTPALQPFFGGTYMPADAFLRTAEALHDAYVREREAVVRQAGLVTRAVQRPPSASVPRAVTAEMLDAAFRKGAAQVDPVYGGQPGRMKFPTAVRWHALLHRYRRTGDQCYARAVRVTLDAMASGGLYDHVGGGFHRYAVDRAWLVPHFEKMLYDNALLAALYTEAWVVFREPRYGEVARDTMEFIIRDMGGPDGELFASMDADSGGEEGAFYTWTPGELSAAVGPADAPALAMLLGVTPDGNFEGRTVLTRRTDPTRIAQRAGRDADDVNTLFARWRGQLAAARGSRTLPTLDHKVITAWAGLAAGALATGHQVFGEPRYLQAAERAADFLWRAHRRCDGTLWRSSTDGQPAGEGVLDDYACLAMALFDLFESTSNPEHARRGLEMVATLRDRFVDAGPSFRLTARGHDTPLGPGADVFDNALPSGSAVALHALIRAASLTGNMELLGLVRSAFEAHAAAMSAHGMDMAWWLDGVELLLGPPLLIVVAGDGSDPRTRELLEAYRGTRAPHACLVRVPPEGPDEAALTLFPPVAGLRAAACDSVARVCEPGQCRESARDGEGLRRLLTEGWHC